MWSFGGGFFKRLIFLNWIYLQEDKLPDPSAIMITTSDTVLKKVVNINNSSCTVQFVRQLRCPRNIKQLIILC